MSALAVLTADQAGIKLRSADSAFPGLELKCVITVVRRLLQ
ncbi:rCG28668 [Rattus norvegicus]|uniref:RCG28668 n=1 Tax=Rattus norvegicus TaxID=10116 RepID=A6HWH8_RAT|nr:rCG28668 [Rattus norvegicus]